MKNFSVELTILSDDDSGVFIDASSIVKLPDHQAVTADQLNALALKVADVVSEFLQNTYQEAEVYTAAEGEEV